jgi:signal recognition particle receptor subunit beta
MFSKQQYKIIFTGPVGAGKTTAIRALSDIEPISTEQLATDHVADRKSETTVAMDYGSMTLDGQERIHLYGTPGQKRFDFMWDILTTGGLGLIILLDNNSDNPISDMRYYLDSFKDFLNDHKLSIGVNFMNHYQPDAPEIDDYCQELQSIGMNSPIFEVDCREYHDVSMLVQSLIYSSDPWLGK